MSTATCPGCGATYDVTGRLAGHHLPCPACRTEIVVPEPEPAPETAVYERARSKLEATRRYGGEPIGPNTRRTVVLAVFCGLPFVVGLLIVALAADDAAGVLTGLFWITIVLLLPLAPWPILAHVRSRPETPERAVREFYRCVARGDHRRAYGLVVAADKDDLERYQPEHVEILGQPSYRPMRFSDPGEFRRYWQEMLRARTWPICQVKIRGLHVVPRAPDLAVASFDLTVRTNTSLYVLGILLGLPGILVALIIQAATYKTVLLPVERVLVQVGDEWRLFSGEWQGWDEVDLGWLEERD